MKVLFYSSRYFEKKWLDSANIFGYETIYTEDALNINTAEKAKGIEVISVFINDDVSAPVLKKLSKYGIKFIALRHSGFDNVDIMAANENGIQVANVPQNPYSVAEQTVALMLALNRKLIKGCNQVHLQNFLVDDLIGFEMNRKVVGIMGTGKVGSALAKILHGFGCMILAYDADKNQQLISRYDVHYVTLDTLFTQSDIISVHLPLTKDTTHLVNKTYLNKTKKGIMLINTSNGAVLKTDDVISFIENGHISFLGLDVYENENLYVFKDFTGKEMHDQQLKKLLGFNNVLITPHQSLLTSEALQNMAENTFFNIHSWLNKTKSGNEITYTGVEELIPISNKKIIKGNSVL